MDEFTPIDEFASPDGFEPAPHDPALDPAHDPAHDSALHPVTPGPVEVIVEGTPVDAMVDTAYDPHTAEKLAASKSDLFDAAGSPVHEGQPGYEHAKALADLEAKRVEDLADQRITTGTVTRRIVVDGVPVDVVDDSLVDHEITNDGSVGPVVGPVVGHGDDDGLVEHGVVA